MNKIEELCMGVLPILAPMKLTLTRLFYISKKPLTLIGTVLFNAALFVLQEILLFIGCLKLHLVEELLLNLCGKEYLRCIETDEAN